MSIRTHGRPRRCPHCDEWLVTPEQAKKQKRQANRFVIIVTITMITIIFGLIFIITTSESPTKGLEQMAYGTVVDIDYWSDGAYEVYFSNLYVDGVPKDIKRYVFSFSDSITATPMIDQVCIFWGRHPDSSRPSHEVQYIEYV